MESNLKVAAFQTSAVSSFFDMGNNLTGKSQTAIRLLTFRFHNFFFRKIEVHQTQIYPPKVTRGRWRDLLEKFRSFVVQDRHFHLSWFDEFFYVSLGIVMVSADFYVAACLVA